MARPPVAVAVASAFQKTIPIEIQAIGNVESCQTVSIKSQITGPITKVYFKEGQDVRKGDLLFKLDCRPFEEALKQAEAVLQRDTVQAGHAENDLKRYAALLEDQYVTKQQYDQMRTNWAALQATLKSDRSAVESSRVQTEYCSVHAPIDGKTGAIKMNQGNIAKANEAEVVVINQIQPIYVTFAIPEKDLSSVKKLQAQGKLAIEARITGEEKPEKGTLTFIDNAVNKATGTITLKGTFANGERRLWPGQFVNVTMTLTRVPNAILVPTPAVLTGQSGQFIFVVKPDMTVEMRAVASGATVQGDTVILKGLQAGERVVTDGQMRLTPGAKVSIKTAS